MSAKVRLVAFDLDGTLTQHKTPLSSEARALLNALSQRYRLVMVGAGACMRIHNQMERYPVDILGNYGMQSARYSGRTKTLELYEDISVPVDRDRTEKRVTTLRQRFGYTAFSGDSVEYHASGMITFPLLGTSADIEDKLRFDPDRSLRKAMFTDVRDTFDDYTVFIGGSSSFDIVPRPYNKLYALDRFCARHGLRREQVVYVGDDYGVGGNDEDVYRSDIRFVCVDDYRKVGECLKGLLA